jgi:hypothetical protein
MTTHVIEAGELVITTRTRRLRPWTWSIRVRGAIMSSGVGWDGFATSAWNLVARLDADGCTTEAGDLRKLLVTVEEGQRADEHLLARLADSEKEHTEQ